ncbi:MAG TPA: hypothetical protein VGR40_03835 [Candidatus Binatus sp.]|nr:hypothetical protein [Candidatus Binatus sp.]
MGTDIRHTPTVDTTVIPGMAVGIIGMLMIGVIIELTMTGGRVAGMNGMAVAVVTSGTVVEDTPSPTKDTAADTITADLTKASNFTRTIV